MNYYLVRIGEGQCIYCNGAQTSIENYLLAGTEDSIEVVDLENLSVEKQEDLMLIAETQDPDYMGQHEIPPGAEHARAKISNMRLTPQLFTHDDNGDNWVYVGGHEEILASCGL
mgnify:CR=1 FL=1